MVGYHAVFERSFEDAIRLARTHDFDFVQFDLGVPAFHIDNITGSVLSRIQRAMREEGIAVTFHAPGDHLGLTTDYVYVRDALLKLYSDVLAVAHELAAHHVTFHPFVVPSFNRADSSGEGFEDRYRDHYVGVATETLRYLNRIAGGVMISVENMNLRSYMANAMAAFLSEDTNVRLTLDFAKLLNSDGVVNEGQLAFYTAHKPMVCELHVHNMKHGRGQHLPPEDGLVDYQAFADWLSLDHVWTTIEVRPVEVAAHARKWLRKTFGV